MPREDGMLDGLHYTEHVETVKSLARLGHLDEAAGLLLRLLDAVERQAAAGGPMGGFLAPWYFEQLAIVYRKLKRFDLEAKVLRRYVLGCSHYGEQPASGVMRRLERAQSLDVEATNQRVNPHLPKRPI
jgi:hypothetical protein